MNVDDVKADFELPPRADIIPAIFRHQHALALKYGPIERKNGFYYPDLDQGPSIDDAQFQYWIKGMLWRTAEEIAEAIEVTPPSIPNKTGWWKEQWETNSDLRHFFEELADALHFLVEVSILANIDGAMITFEGLLSWGGERADALFNPMVVGLYTSLGLVGNTLKNKPWKSTQMSTDSTKFQAKLLIVWKNFMALWGLLGCDIEDIFVLYMKKNTVNQFRIRTNY